MMLPYALSTSRPVPLYEETKREVVEQTHTESSIDSAPPGEQHAR